MAATYLSLSDVFCVLLFRNILLRILYEFYQVFVAITSDINAVAGVKTKS